MTLVCRRRRHLDTCVNDDSTSDSFGDTCSTYYDYIPTGCGGYDDEEFTTVDPHGVRAKILARRHDASRPPLTRIRDADKDEQFLLGDLQLAGDGSGFVSEVTLVSADDPFDPEAKSNGNFLPLLRGDGYHTKFSGLIPLANYRKGEQL